MRFAIKNSKLAKLCEELGIEASAIQTFNEVIPVLQNEIAYYQRLFICNSAAPLQRVILVEHVCDRCGGEFETTELNSQEKQILDQTGKWKTERTYRCYDCEREALLGNGAP